jgi:hypothetical protein
MYLRRAEWKKRDEGDEGERVPMKGGKWGGEGENRYRDAKYKGR